MSEIIEMNFAKKEEFLEAVGVDDQPLFMGTNQMFFEDETMSVSVILNYLEVVEGTPILMKWEQPVGREKQLTENNVKYMSEQQVNETKLAMKQLDEKVKKTFNSLHEELETRGCIVYDGYISEHGE